MRFEFHRADWHFFTLVSINWLLVVALVVGRWYPAALAVAGFTLTEFLGIGLGMISVATGIELLRAPLDLHRLRGLIGGGIVATGVLKVLHAIPAVLLSEFVWFFALGVMFFRASASAPDQ